MNSKSEKTKVVVHRAPVERLAYRPKELPALTGIGQGRIYELIAQGVLPSMTIGRRILIPADALKRFLNGEAHL